MIPLKITLHNFLSYVSPKPLDFFSFDLAVLLGENGAGKSSILEALTWTVWEKTRANSSDDLIHQGMQEMWVDFIFEHEGEVYRIFRRRDRKKQGISTLEFQVKEKNKLPRSKLRGIPDGESLFPNRLHPRSKSSTVRLRPNRLRGIQPLENKKNLLEETSWKTISEGTLRLTQEKIINTIKLPYEIFVNTSYLRQGRADEFTIKTPAERKEILGEILGLEEWGELEEKTRNKLRAISNEIEVLNYQLEDLKNQISQKKYFEDEFEKQKKQKEIQQKKLEILEKEYKKIDEQKKQKDFATEKIINLRDRLEEIINEIKNLEQEKNENTQEILSFSNVIKNKNNIIQKYQQLEILKDKQEKIEKKQETYLKLKEKLIFFDHQENEFKNKISKLKQISTCPTCLRLLRKKEAEEIIQSLENEYTKKYLPQKKEIENDLKKLEYSEKVYQKIKVEIQNLKGFEEQKRNLALAQDYLKKLNGHNQKINENLKSKFSQRQKIILAGTILKKQIQKLEKIVPQWEELSENLVSKRQELLNLEGKFGATLQALKEFSRIQADLNNKEKRLKELAKENTLLQELVEAFGKKGIQAMIIEQAIPAIEENANEILKQVSDEQMSLKFITQKIKKTAEELIETLEIKITDTQGERDYEMFSGGEAFRINFAIRVALSKFLALRSGIHLRFLAMDEGFGTLDAAGREDLIKTINSIQKDFAKIIIITHINELKDIFPTQILISKSENGSQIETIG